MKLFLSSLVFLFFSLIPFVAKSAIPESAWEQHPEGLALALFLKTTTVEGQEKDTIRVFMKNTSTTLKRYVGPDLYNVAVEIFYENNEGKQVPLRDYSPPSGTPLPPPEIKPGAIFLRTVDLTPDELTLIKTHRISAHISITDDAGKQNYYLQSALQLVGPQP
jgi:hypothetical protein